MVLASSTFYIKLEAWIDLKVEYDYQIQFSFYILVCRLHIIKSQTHPIPNQQEKQGRWKYHKFEIKKNIILIPTFILHPTCKLLNVHYLFPVKQYLPDIQKLASET